MEQKKEVKRVTNEDLDWFWREHGIGVADIRQIPGYEDFELVMDYFEFDGLNNKELDAPQNQNQFDD